MRQEDVLLSAEFNRKVISYYVLSTCLVLAITVFGIALIPVVLLLANWFGNKYLARLSCDLTTRSLHVRRGVFSRVESTVPLDKVTDLAFYQGPLMRAFDLAGLRVETAGQSSGPGSSLIRLVGIVDARNFRDRVLEQRDLVTDRAPAPGGEPQTPASASALAAAGLGAGNETIEVLRDIRDALGRIEGKLDSR